MTPQEFKAWFDGFCEGIGEMPTPQQWGKVKERVAQIDGKPISYPVFVDRYWPRWLPYTFLSASGVVNGDAMHTLGKVEASSITTRGEPASREWIDEEQSISPEAVRALYAQTAERGSKPALRGSVVSMPTRSKGTGALYGRWRADRV